MTKHAKNKNNYKSCKNYTGMTFPKKLVLISKNRITGKSKCAIYLTERTFIEKIDDYDLEKNWRLWSDVIKEIGDLLRKV